MKVYYHFNRILFPRPAWWFKRWHYTDWQGEWVGYRLCGFEFDTLLPATDSKANGL